MKLEQSTQAKIKKLAESINNEPLGIKPSSHSGPVLVKTQNAGNISRMFTLSGMQAQLYLDVLQSLGKEIALEHLTRADLDNALIGLVVDLDSNRQQDSREIRQRIGAFVSEIARLPLDYEVLFVIEPVVFGSESLTIGDVVFQELTHELAKEWNFAKDDLTNQAVGVVKVKAGTTDKALERAQNLFDRALNILRVCVGSSDPRRMIWDEQLLQRRNGLGSIRQLNDPTAPVEARLDWTSVPIQLEVSSALAYSTKEFIERLSPLYDGTIQGRLRDALLRSLEWMGTSITRDNYDHKVVDLCIALESALTTKDDKRKGEAIAFRMMLLSMALDKSFPAPARLYQLYDLRSSVVHGADLGVCGKSDYYTLQKIAEGTVLNIIELIGKQRSVTRPSKLIGYLESAECLESAERIERAIDWLKQRTDKDTKAITKYAEDKLA